MSKFDKAPMESLADRHNREEAAFIKEEWIFLNFNVQDEARANRRENTLITIATTKTPIDGKYNTWFKYGNFEPPEGAYSEKQFFVVEKGKWKKIEIH